MKNPYSIKSVWQNNTSLDNRESHVGHCCNMTGNLHKATGKGKHKQEGKSRTCGQARGLRKSKGFRQDEVVKDNWKSVERVLESPVCKQKPI